MSKKTELRADLNRIGYQLGGAHLTQEARRATFSTFAQVMREKGYGIKSAEQIGGRHLQAYVDYRLAQEVSSRTIANEMSHVRAVLIHCGKEGLARNPEYSNKALGIGRGSRIGTKQPLTDAAIHGFQKRMDRLGRNGIGVSVELQRALGCAKRKPSEAATRKLWLDGAASFRSTAMCTSSREPRAGMLATHTLPTLLGLG